MSEIKTDRRYRPSHEWVLLDGEVATIGISDFAQDALGDVVFFDLPEEGDDLTQGESFAEVESVKAVSDVYAPFDGTIVAINEALSDTPELINQDPFGAGWMIKVKLSDPSSYESLLDAEAYKSNCEG
jgi:glycine cleavage system H protein